jgi:ribosome biogenesis GTPase A
MKQMYYCVILGETGKGKSSFLNALFKNNDKSMNLKTSDGNDGFTKKIQPYNLDIENDKYIIFDTPGLNIIH